MHNVHTSSNAISDQHQSRPSPIHKKNKYPILETTNVVFHSSTLHRRVKDLKIHIPNPFHNHPPTSHPPSSYFPQHLNRTIPNPDTPNLNIPNPNPATSLVPRPALSLPHHPIHHPIPVPARVIISDIPVSPTSHFHSSHSFLPGSILVFTYLYSVALCLVWFCDVQLT